MSLDVRSLVEELDALAKKAREHADYIIFTGALRKNPTSVLLYQVADLLARIRAALERAQAIEAERDYSVGRLNGRLAEEVEEGRKTFGRLQRIEEAARVEKERTHSVYPTRAVCAGPNGGDNTLKCPVCLALTDKGREEGSKPCYICGGPQDGEDHGDFGFRDHEYRPESSADGGERT